MIVRDYRETYGERLGGFLNWLNEHTDFGQWDESVKKEVIEKLDNAWVMNLAEMVQERDKYREIADETNEHRKNYNDLVHVLKRILRV